MGRGDLFATLLAAEVCGCGGGVAQPSTIGGVGGDRQGEWGPTRSAYTLSAGGAGPERGADSLAGEENVAEQRIDGRLAAFLRLRTAGAGWVPHARGADNPEGPLVDGARTTREEKKSSLRAIGLLDGSGSVWQLGEIVGWFR